MNIGKTAALLSIVALALAANAQGRPDTAPNPKGQWTPKAWNPKLVQGLPKAEPHFTSTVTAPLGTTSPMFEPNKGGKWRGEKITAYDHPEKFTEPPAQGVGIQSGPVIIGFDGIGQTSLTPPDNSIAVGQNYIVETVNSTWRISDKCGNTLYENTINSFLGDNGFIFDCRVMFDPWRARWIMLWHKLDTAAKDSRLILVVSDDSDPFGNWWWYYFPGDTGSGATEAWCDNYDLGYGSAALHASGNQFTYSGSSFTTATFRTWNPSEIYNALSASMITDQNLTNADGSATFAPRVARMLNGGNGGVYFANSRAGGGDRITVWSLTDPLGAHSLSRFDKVVNQYASPPDARDQAGNTIATNDARLTTAYGVFSSALGRFRIVTGLCCANPSQNGYSASRLYVLDANGGTTDLDWNYWHSSQWNYYASPAANYENTFTWVYSYSSNTSGFQAYPSMAYVSFYNETFTNSYVVAKAGTSGYGGYRWGDYFQGDLDWGDYYGGGGSTGHQKLWMYGEYAKSGQWATYVAATRTDNITSGTLTTNTTGAMSWSGYEGQSFANGGYNTTVGNSGNVGFNYLVSTPSWLTASPDSGQIFEGGSTVVNIDANANASALPYGHYTGNAVFENCYSGATRTRSADLYVWAIVNPTAFAVKLGKQNSGNLASLQAADGNALRVCKFVVPNATAAPVQVEITAKAPGSTTGGVYFITRAKMANNGVFQQRMEMWNKNTANWDTTDFRTDALTTSYAYFTLASTGNHNRYIDAGNVLKAKYSVKATGPSAVALWCVDTDTAYWILSPP
ncbi:MAG: hypothetical protein JST30_09855 [Armatimonadetes bacterium]|nr:hypothetical protein [Armatimonadota bacterium]